MEKRHYFWFGFCVGNVFLAIVIALLNTMEPPRVPSCQEDEILVGTGEFHNGYWTHYECGPTFDDILIGRMNNG